MRRAWSLLHVKGGLPDTPRRLSRPGLIGNMLARLWTREIYALPWICPRPDNSLTPTRFLEAPEDESRSAARGVGLGYGP
jgi:hypothetical protein